MSKKQRILADHKRIGKKFIPPFFQLQLSGNFRPIKWLDNVLPEIIWIALLQEKFGVKQSVDICTNIVLKAKSILQGNNIGSLAIISNYNQLNELQFNQLKECLMPNNFLLEISLALEPLTLLYPSCPLNKVILVKQEHKIKDVLFYFKTVVEKYFYREELHVNTIEATAVHMSILGEAIVYANNVMPPNLKSQCHF